MPRHAAPRDRSFYRSLARAAGRALLVLAVVGLVVVGLTQFRRGDDQDVALAPEASPTSATPDATPTPPQDILTELAEDPDRAVVDIAPSSGASPAAPAAPAAPEGARNPAEVTVQMVRGTENLEAYASAVARVRQLGYQVTLESVAGTGSPVTTVLYAEGNAADAEALRAADPRFAEVKPNDRFQTPVDLHVLVGDDFPA